MNYLFFDTETTGLPANYKAHFSDVNNWPRVVQLAWMLTNEEGKVLTQACDIIRPDGYQIPPNMIHGISQEKAEEVGVSMLAAFNTFADAAFSEREGALAIVDALPTLVAHNIGFDLPIVSAELMRLNQEKIAKLFNRQLKQQCTQAIGTNYCKLPNKNGYSGYKWPRLSELHQILFNEGFDGAHDAMNDVKATARCFFELKRLGVIPN